MAELKVVYGNRNARDFCVKEEKQSYIQMDEIMKRLFSLQNKVPIIDFLNAVYKQIIPQIIYNISSNLSPKVTSALVKNDIQLPPSIYSLLLH